jgi:phospholipid/cholesterol/gamma-HCH transport system substrate-binding protein
MNSTQQTIRVGLFFLLGVALIWVTFETLSGGNHFFRKEGYELIASFGDIKELKVGDDVRMAGVKIGTVEKTRLSGRRAQAVLLISPGIEVADDANAAITMAGLLGTDYVSVDLGSAGVPPLKDGDEIRTRETPDINTIMSELGDLGKNLNGALGSLSSSLNGNGQPGGGLFQKLDKLVTDNSAKMTVTMDNLREISDKLNHGQGTLGKLINDPELHDQLLASVNQIKSAASDAQIFMGDARGIVDQIKSGQGTLGTLLYDPTTAANLKVTIQNVRDVSDKINRGEGSLGKLLNDDSLFNEAQTTLKKADRAIDSLNDSGPITAVGVVANSLF